MTYDPDTITAFVDGELDEVTARRIAQDAQSDSALAADIERHRTLRSRLAAHFDPVLDEDIPDQLTSLLASDSKIDTSLWARRVERKARFSSVHWGAMAASLVLGLTVGLSPWSPSASVVSHDGILVASGPLATALDTQLASAQANDAPVRIGLSFKDHGGRLCRTFESAALAGIGCRDEGRWLLDQTIRGKAASEYRQASSGTIAAAAADMMEGDPLDASQERQARDSSWVP